MKIPLKKLIIIDLIKNNNPTPSADFNNSIDNNNLPENNNNINPSSVSSAEDNPNLHELQNY